METLLNTSWPIARYRFEFIVTTCIRLPDYAGSTLRGAFGHALRSVACMTKEKNCKQCPLYQDCAYTNIFEAPAPEHHALQKFSQIPNAYVFEPPPRGAKVYAPGQLLTFHLVLFGKANARLSLIIFALQKAFAQEVGHGTARLDKVWQETETGDALIYSEESTSISRPHPEIRITTLPKEDEVVLSFSTPLRLQHNGKILEPHEITASDVLMTLARRIGLIREFHCGQVLNLDYAGLKNKSLAVGFQQNLKWQSFTRYSNRQNRFLNYNGLVGECAFSRLDEIFLPLLVLGTWIHVGKGATFGLGKYSIL